MKTILSVLLTSAALTFALMGCSDNPTMPVSPAGMSMSAPGHLSKTIESDFTFVLVPTDVTDPGVPKSPDGKAMLRGLRGPVYFTAAFADGSPDLLTGPGEIEVNGLTDFSAGVGKWYGKLIVRPVAPEAGGGIWEFNWHGTATLGATGWTLPLKEQAHGVGGALTGMQCRLENTVMSPPELFPWSGGGTGVVTSH